MVAAVRMRAQLHIERMPHMHASIHGVAHLAVSECTETCVHACPVSHHGVISTVDLCVEDGDVF